MQGLVFAKSDVKAKIRPGVKGRSDSYSVFVCKLLLLATCKPFTMQGMSLYYGAFHAGVVREVSDASVYKQQQYKY